MTAEETKTIYDLQLHETLNTTFGICIIRVPGGWIYDCWDSNIDCFKPGNFVPYCADFKEHEKYTPPF